jgi:acetyl esterase/lipase
MQKTIIQGRLSHRMLSLATSLAVGANVLLRRLVGRPTVPGWPLILEYGTLYYRAQFNHAFRLKSIAEGRDYFDSVYTLREQFPDVDVRESGPDEPRGHWFTPSKRANDGTVLYFHGGGYAFYFEVSRHFISMLAHRLGMPIFAPDYRLTPENPHPAQLEDGLHAYRHLLAIGISPDKLIICGDSAGGHLALMVLAKLRGQNLPAPAMAIALSPWTDTGLRRSSQFGNDPYDMVQGYMTVQFAKWLHGETLFTSAQTSPINKDFRRLCPIYIQAGGKEILVDMIRDFVRAIRNQGASVRLDVWEQMNHEFQAYSGDLPESQHALQRINEAVNWALRSTQSFPPCACTEMESAEGWTQMIASTFQYSNCTQTA